MIDNHQLRHYVKAMIRQVPYFMIINPQGELVAQGRDAIEPVEIWLQEAGLMQ
jgi:hypothetical protein